MKHFAVDANCAARNGDGGKRANDDARRVKRAEGGKICCSSSENIYASV